MAVRACLVGLLLLAVCGTGVQAAAPPALSPTALLGDLSMEPDQRTLRAGNDLSWVPELIVLEGFTGLPAPSLTSRPFDAARRLNAREKDGFVKALIRQRSDLAGLPFLLGDDCRLPRARARLFQQEAATI